MHLVSENLSNFKRGNDSKKSLKMGSHSDHMKDVLVNDLKELVNGKFWHGYDGGKNDYDRLRDNAQDYIDVIKRVISLGADPAQIEISGDSISFKKWKGYNSNHVSFESIFKEDVEKWVEFMKKYAMEKYPDNFTVSDETGSMSSYWQPKGLNEWLDRRFGKSS